MSLSSISIRRPVLATVMSILILVFGIIGFSFLGVREFPAVDPPTITVTTAYRGASADIIESQITEIIEESVNGIAGIRSITSVSREQQSSITVEFDLGVDLDVAANDVRDRVSRVVRSLPVDADPPTVAKADANSFPIIMLTVHSETRDILDVTAIGTRLKERFQTIPGVAEVRIWGEKKYAMRLWLDPKKLAAYNLTVLDVRNALNAENVELPSGRIEGQTTELSVRTMGLLKTPEDFNKLIIRAEGARVVRFQDVGRASLGAENERTILKKNGVPMIGLALTAQPGANNLSIAEEFHKRFAKIKDDVPKDVILRLGFDSTRFIKKSILEVQETVFIAFGLVLLIIFIFLRDWRTTLIPVIAIPVSLVGTFFVMYLAGFTINVLTLLGIVLAIGLVVDDAIVVLENIYAKIEKGMDPVEAGHKGAAEIFFAVVSTTLVLGVVFLPIIFLQGFTGRLFREFGVVVAGSVFISAFVSLTLTPMMTSRIVKTRQKHSRFYERSEPFFHWLQNGYRSSLDSFIEKRWLALVILAGTLGATVFFFLSLKEELAPMEDRSMFMVNATAQEGSTFEYMDAYMDRMIKLVGSEVPESDVLLSVTAPGFSASAGVNSGFIRMYLVDPEHRTRSQAQISQTVFAKLRGLSGARVNVVQDQTIQVGARAGLPMQLIIQAPNFEKLKEVLPKFVEEARKDPTFSVVDENLKLNKPELRVEIDREKMRSLGVSVRDVATALQLAFSGLRFDYFVKDGRQYQVIGQVAREFRNEPGDLKNITVKNNQGETVSLDNLVSYTEQINPPQLYRYNRYVSATVSAGLAPGMTLGDGIKAMQGVATKVLDETYVTALAGPARDQAEASSGLLFALLLAIVLVYLVLAAQFESYRDPLIVMLTVPLALAGAFMALWYFNQTRNIFSNIGIIMLIGLVTKNGILIVEFANQRRHHGLDLVAAVKDAAASRFRPILMTTLATVLGTLPIALALGAGAKSRMPMGIAVVGGLLFSLVLTLYVVPAMYTFLSKQGDLTRKEDVDPVDKAVGHGHDRG
ncbi:MAG: efflux RND transporter permease subunit [Fibrobacterota bacterium]|nr:efflux RND transporter permease subunit [Fibrobacterota bacterium]